MTATDKMLSRKEGQVGYLTFNNPERHNAVSLDMWEAAEGYLDEFKNDKNIRVVVVTGAGGKAFVSGADISKFADERATKAGSDRYNEAVDRAYEAFYAFPKPTIAMIRGYCIGGGVGLALCCDMRICTEGSKFAVPAAKLSLGYRYSFWRRLAGLKDAQLRAEAVMEDIGLARRRDTPAGILSYAEQRALEIGITIASGADVILLDEPTAGMSNNETEAAVALIRRVTEGKTLVMVEHDMGVVFGLADRISVLVYGQIIATDTPAAIRSNAAVQEAYLGTSVNHD